jgi:hypothetical protein
VKNPSIATRRDTALIAARPRTLPAARIGRSATRLAPTSWRSRITWLAAFVYLSARGLTDDLVDLLIQTIHQIGARAERKVERELLDDLKRVTSKQNLLFELADATLAQPDGVVRDVVFPVVGEQTLRDLVKWKATGPTYRVTLRTVIRNSYQGHYQRRIAKPVARLAPFRLRETGDLYGQWKSEAIERADSHRIKQQPLLLGLRGNGAPEQISDVVYFVAQSLKAQPAGRLRHRIKLAPQQVGADHDGDGQTLHALRKLEQHVPMYFNSFIAQVDSENRLRLAAREARYFQRMSWIQLRECN